MHIGVDALTSYIAGRFGQFLLVVLGTLVLVFFALQVTTDPAVFALPLGTPDTVIDDFNASHGFDDPLGTQLVSFLGNAAQGDFGQSLWLRDDSLDLALSRLPATAMIALPAVFGGAVIGIALATIVARRPGSRLAQVMNVVTYGLLSIAEFWIGIVLIVFVSVRLGWLPTGGYDPKPKVLVMPILVLMLRPLAQTFQLAQTTMSAEYGKQYVLAARARGLSEGDVARRHVLRNAAIPVVTLVMYELGRVFVGTAVIVEVVFGWPGIGRLAIDALEHGDVFLVQAVAVVAAVAVASTNLVADILYFFLDPRTRSLVKDPK